MITVSSISTDTYNTLRWTAISAMEQTRYAPYLDSATPPQLTIGIGFNIQGNLDLRAAVYTALGLGSDDNDYKTQLDTAIQNHDITQMNQIMHDRWVALGQPAGVPNSFTLPISTDLRGMFDTSSGTPTDTGSITFEAKLNTWLGSATLATSSERVALLSLMYNGLLTISGSNGTDAINPTLQSDVRNGNRADAWYQIRYASNKHSLDQNPPDGVDGIAKRRYYESQLFGLYDPGAVTPTESSSIYQVITAHRDNILRYEQRYSGDIDGTNPSHPSANAILDYHLSGSPYTPQSLAAVLQPAADVLNAQYGHGKTFDPLDIYVASGSYDSIVVRGYTTGSGVAEHDSLLIGSDGVDVLIGGYGNDILVAGTGSDTLWGGIAGNDTLVAGQGQSAFLQGSTYGADTFDITSGSSGNAGDIKIDDSFGDWRDSTIKVGGQVIGASTTATGDKDVWTDNSNGLTYDFLPQAGSPSAGTLVILGGALGQGGEIDIKNFDLQKAESSSGYLGIHLDHNKVALQTGVPVVAPGGAVGSNSSTNLASGGTQVFTFSCDVAQDVDQTVTVTLGGGGNNYGFNTGSTFVAGKKLTLTIPKGQQSVSFALVNTAPDANAEQVTLTATLGSGDSSITSNTITVNVAQGATNAAVTPPDGSGTPIDPYAVLDSDGNPVKDKASGLNEAVNDGTVGSGDSRTYVSGDKKEAGISGDASFLSATDGNNIFMATGAYDHISAGGGGNSVVNALAGDEVSMGSGKNAINIKGNNTVLLFPLWQREMKGDFVGAPRAAPALVDLQQAAL